MSLGRVNKRVRDQLTYDNRNNPVLETKVNPDDVKQIIEDNPDIIKPIIDNAVTSICLTKSAVTGASGETITIAFPELLGKDVIAMYSGLRAKKDDVNTGHAEQVITTPTATTGSVGSGLNYTAYLYDKSTNPSHYDDNFINPRFEIRTSSGSRAGETIEAYALFLIPKISN